MKMAVKAALWSGLAFPGAGHFILKRYVRAAVLGMLTVLAFGYLVNDVMQKASAIADQILIGAISVDSTAMTALVVGGGSDSKLVDVAGYVVLACWVAGIVDSYRIGNMKDLADHRKPTQDS